LRSRRRRYRPPNSAAAGPPRPLKASTIGGSVELTVKIAGGKSDTTARVRKRPRDRSREIPPAWLDLGAGGHVNRALASALRAGSTHVGDLQTGSFDRLPRAAVCRNPTSAPRRTVADGQPSSAPVLAKSGYTARWPAEPRSPFETVLRRSTKAGSAWETLEDVHEVDSLQPMLRAARDH
jgi:hypothetical protein